MKKLKLGVIGLGRGMSLSEYCRLANNAEIVAICDKWKEGLDRERGRRENASITYYENYDEFLKHDMDAVLLANYANEHAPFAIKAMEAGKDVISEVLPCQTMKEAVELVETIERTGRTYCYGENYCYMPAPYEMRRRFRAGEIGDFEYAEGEYIHNCEPIWPGITYGERDHWRNTMYATFYCTHSIGPIVHITGHRPKKVVGFELPFSRRNARMGSRSGNAGIEMITFDNGAVMKSIHGGLQVNSIWYTLYGTKGCLESEREIITDTHGIGRLYSDVFPEETAYGKDERKTDDPVLDEAAQHCGHGGSDYYMMWNAVEKLLGNPEADTIDVYEALDMFLPGMFAYRSILAGGIPMDIPDLRSKEERDKWRNDTTCTDKAVAGDMYVPPYSKGEPDIPDVVYERIRETWLETKKMACDGR